MFSVTTQSPILNGLSQFLQKLSKNLAARHETNGDPLRDLDLTQIGLCNRITCGDLYKIIDEFRNSELYTSLKTMLYLMQDDNGLQVILSSLNDPQLINNLFDKDKLSLLKIKVDGIDKESPKRLIDKSRFEKNVDSKLDYVDYYDGKDSSVEKIQRIQAQKVTPNVIIGTTRGVVDHYEYYYHHASRG